MAANPSKGGYVRTPHQIAKALVEDERNSVVHGCAHACLFPRMRVTGIWVSKQVEAVGRTFPLLTKYTVHLSKATRASNVEHVVHVIHAA